MLSLSLLHSIPHAFCFVWETLTSTPVGLSLNVTSSIHPRASLTLSVPATLRKLHVLIYNVFILSDCFLHNAYCLYGTLVICGLM